jgi:hypothetical protein
MGEDGTEGESSPSSSSSSAESSESKGISIQRAFATTPNPAALATIAAGIDPGSPILVIGREADDYVGFARKYGLNAFSASNDQIAEVGGKEYSKAANISLVVRYLDDDRFIVSISRQDDSNLVDTQFGREIGYVNSEVRSGSYRVIHEEGNEKWYGPRGSNWADVQGYLGLSYGLSLLADFFK